MKITFDTKTNQVKVGSKVYGVDLDATKSKEVEHMFREFILKNTPMDMYEEDSMWMSYRYSVGSHTIATHQRAADIKKHCYGRMSDERSIFTAYDINREIENKLVFGPVAFYFDNYIQNRLVVSAFDVFCEFLEDYDIKSVEDLIKYKSVRVKYDEDLEKKYSLKVTTWEEELNRATSKEDRDSILKEMPNKDYVFMSSSYDDLIIWNDLCHIFDKEHHHKSRLINGEVVEWCWTWVNKTNDEGYQIFGYKKIRIPIDKWNGVYTTWIPDESIEEDLE